MSLILFHWLLLACAAVALATNDDATRSKRDLQFIKDIILSKFSGNKETQVPATSSPEYKFVRVPGFRTVLVKTSKIPINLVEIKVPGPSDSETAVSIPTIAIVEYMGTNTKNITSTSVKGVNDLQYGVLDDNVAIDTVVPEVPYSRHINYLPEQVSVAKKIESKGYQGLPSYSGSYDYKVPIKGTIKLQNPYEIYNLAPKFAPPRLDDVIHEFTDKPVAINIPAGDVVSNPVNEEQNVVKVSHVVPVSPVHTKYSYKQVKNDGSVISYTANDNFPVSVTKTTKPLPPQSPSSHLIDGVPQITSGIPLDIKPFHVETASVVPKPEIVDMPASIANSFTNPTAHFISPDRVIKNIPQHYFENTFPYKQIYPDIAYLNPNAVQQNRHEGSSATLTESNKANFIPSSIISNSDGNIAVYSASSEIPDGELGPLKLVNGEWYVNNDDQAYLPENDVVFDYNSALTAYNPIRYDRPPLFGVIDEYPTAISGNHFRCPYTNFVFCQNLYNTPSNFKIPFDNFHKATTTINRPYDEGANQENVYVAPVTRYSYKHRTNNGEYINKDGVAHFINKISERDNLKNKVVEETISKTRDGEANDSLKTNPIVVPEEQVYINKQNITDDSSTGAEENSKNVAVKTNKINIQTSKEVRRGDIPDATF